MLLLGTVIIHCSQNQRLHSSTLFHLKIDTEPYSACHPERSLPEILPSLCSALLCSSASLRSAHLTGQTQSNPEGWCPYKENVNSANHRVILWCSHRIWYGHARTPPMSVGAPPFVRQNVNNSANHGEFLHTKALSVSLTAATSPKGVGFQTRTFGETWGKLCAAFAPHL